MATYDWSDNDPPRTLWAEAWRPALRLAGVYLVVATTWIIASDWVVDQITDDPVLVKQLQTFKGMCFVLISAGLLLFMAYTRLARLTQSQQELARSRRVLKTLLGNLPGMAYRCLNDGAYTPIIVSEGAKELTGYEAETFRNGQRSLIELLHPDDMLRVRQHVDRAVALKAPFRLEYRLPRADGTIRWVCEQGIPVFNEEGELEALEGFVTDIHERKRAEQLERERRQLVETRRSMEHDLGVIGHEMRTPLASLRAVAELLMTETNVDLGQQEQLLRAIHDETLRMTEMANNMLEAARLKQAGVSSQWDTVSLAELCQSATSVIQPLVNPTRVTLETEIEAAGLTMRGDFSSLRRLLINLLSNAARHTQDGSIRLCVRTEYDAEHHPCVHLSVQDSGNGIHPDRAKLLGIAFALHHGREDNSGAGLGLTICRDIARSHGGNISFQSMPGEGATFHVRLRTDLDGPQEADEDSAIESESVVI
ncbi:ATP-binding protein [Phycisphaerales bacterium AB-hyl4]|uniref:histidine kinase n=1 Tax=Natronomicrosphaera hydrolytica TaxID=3242702 RepID=A0ABV4U049_9BACT